MSDDPKPARPMDGDDAGGSSPSSTSPPNSGDGGSGSSGFAAERSMTPEQRAEIRQKLLEKQRAAREGTSTVPTTSSSSSSPSATNVGGGSSAAASSSAGSSGPTYSKETGTTVPPRTASGIPAWQLQDADTLLNKQGIPSTEAGTGSAAGSGSTTTSSAPSTPLPSSSSSSPDPSVRENMVAQAVSFLSSPKVQTSPQDRQDAFLKGKGLTDAEISEARRRIGSGSTGSSTSSSTGTTSSSGPAPYTGATASSEALAAKLQQQQAAQNQQAQLAAQQAAREAQEKALQVFNEAMKKREEGLARRQKQDYLLAAILVGGGLLGVAVAVKNLVVSTFNNFSKIYQEHLAHKRTQLINYLTNLSGFLSLYRTPGPPSDPAEAERRVRRTLSGMGDQPEMTVPLTLEKYSNGIEDALERARAAIAERAESIKKRYQLDPPLPRYSYGDPPVASENEIPSDFKTMRRGMDATKRLCESEAYFSATSAYGLGGAGGYWSSSSSNDEKNKSEAAKALHETITDIKSDLRTLKGQLLSRKNFPTTKVPTFTGSWGNPAPASRPAGIPSWQSSTETGTASSAPAATGIPSWQSSPEVSSSSESTGTTLAQPSGSGSNESWITEESSSTEEAVRNSLVATDAQ